MSYQAYFEELGGVIAVLEEYVARQDDKAGVDRPYKRLTEEEFTAIWQSAELLARAYQVLIPLIQLDLGKQALILPDVVNQPSGLILPGEGLAVPE